MTAVRIAVDIGGTFTDAVVVDEESGTTRVLKVLSTPSDPSRGFLHVIDRILEDGAVLPADVAYVVHATTVATNAIIEGKGARTGMILTKGFGDLMEIQRQVRPTLYDLDFEKTPPLVPRTLCVEVAERLDYAGRVLQPLRLSDVDAAVELFRESDVESIAVCLLHSYANPEHEHAIAARIRARLPGVSLSLSSEISPEFREYIRASTTAINAKIRPIVADYLDRIDRELTTRGLPGEILVMQSNGGVLTFEAAREKPVYMVESGPAAGVIFAAYIGAEIGEANVLSFDMGGTTAKAGLIRDGQPQITREFEVGAVASAGTGGRTKASGYPIRTPVVDLVEIGAGGGSIAWVDSGGVLRVGPHSAGAEPGPACYGRSGKHPTVTDANLVLGRLNPDYFLGGSISLYRDAAWKAIEVHCADALGLEVVEVAHGIVEIANTAMTNALRVISIQRGFDPREFALVGFGGAGPVHINRLADELGVRVAVIPVNAGVAAALGLLVTDLRHESSVTSIVSAATAEVDSVNALLASLKASGEQLLDRDGVRRGECTFEFEVDARYVGQSHELPVRIPEVPLVGAKSLDEIERAFHNEHARAYGRAAEGEPVELVNFRVAAIGAIPKPALGRAPIPPLGRAGLRKAERPVYFGEAAGFVETPVYDRYRMTPDDLIVGPAILEEIESTIVVHPGYQAATDVHGNVLLTRTSARDGASSHDR